MAYNVKITEYANGQLEVTTYKQGVYTMLEGAIKSSETAIRECLHRSKAFMRASVLTGLKWQQLFVKAVFCE